MTTTRRYYVERWDRARKRWTLLSTDSVSTQAFRTARLLQANGDVVRLIRSERTVIYEGGPKLPTPREALDACLLAGKPLSSLVGTKVHVQLLGGVGSGKTHVGLRNRVCARCGREELANPTCERCPKPHAFTPRRQRGERPTGATRAVRPSRRKAAKR